MSWGEKAVEEARRRIAEESDLLKKAFSSDFAVFAEETGLYFSFGDLKHLIRHGLNYSIQRRRDGSGAGIAYFETLIMRFRLYLIKELKYVLERKPPFEREDLDFNFVIDFLDLFKILDKLESDLKEIREKEGGFYG